MRRPQERKAPAGPGLGSRHGRNAARSIGGSRPITRSATTDAVPVESCSPARWCPAATSRLSYPGARPIVGLPSGLPGLSPAQDAELLDAADRALETVMLGLRLREGLPLDRLSDVGRRRAEDAVSRGLLEPSAHAGGRAVLTDRGRLLADALVRDLTD